MIKLSGVTKRYGDRTALDSVSLTLESQKIHVFVGSSGSGKSTLLRSILGLVAPESGSILIGDLPVSNMEPRTRAEKMGYVPQDAGLFPHLTAEENIFLASRSLQWSRSRRDERLLDLNKIVLLDSDLLKRYPNELSGGQKQRVALLRALFLNPDIVLMDEPFAALDPLVRAEIQSEVKKLFSRLQKTVIFVTHDIGEAHFLGDQIVLMHDGRVVQKGQLRDLVDHPATEFVTRFLQAQRVVQLF